MNGSWERADQNNGIYGTGPLFKSLGETSLVKRTLISHPLGGNFHGLLFCFSKIQNFHGLQTSSSIIHVCIHACRFQKLWSRMSGIGKGKALCKVNVWKQSLFKKNIKLRTIHVFSDLANRGSWLAWRHAVEWVAWVMSQLNMQWWLLARWKPYLARDSLKFPNLHAFFRKYLCTYFSWSVVFYSITFSITI